jgi:hypothetical protein
VFGFYMASFGKIRINKKSNRGYVHRPKQRSLKQSRKIFIVYKTVPYMQGIA